jgi:DNA-binding NtrC family response regulator
MQEQSIIGQSTEIKRLVALAGQVASTDVTVLITGESGTGKEVFAQYIHQNSRRAKRPFVAVNCGAIPQGLIESELFGHMKGSFTGASASRKGYFESADTGTIFLDEIGELPLETQVKLLRVLENGQFQRVGSSELTQVDTRIVAATNRDLQLEVSQNRFREDLYYRLKSVELYLPPLCERGQDILLLAEKFVHDFEKKHNRTFIGFTTEAAELLLNHDWPGNIRELRNLIESLIVLENDKKITKNTLESYLNRGDDKKPYLKPQDRFENDFEKEMIYRALIQLQTDMSQIKSMLSHLLENPAQNSPQLLLPERAESILSKEDQSEPDTLNLRDILKSFYEEANKNSNTPTLQELEQYAIEETLKQCKGNKRQTAKRLGITERTLYRKLKDYHIGKH